MTRRILLGNLAALLLLGSERALAAPDFNALNAAFGAPVWVDENLWDDNDADVAKRLGWRPESRTESDSSYRLYAGPQVTVLGTRPHSLALYGGGGTASQISMVFANKGDDSSSGFDSVDFKKQITADSKIIADKLTAVLGPPKMDRFGQGQNTREKVLRWDWNDHVIILAAPRGEYVAVRVLPVAVAEGESAGRIGDVALKEKLKSRVEHRENGDVILKDMPMVDQGPKGYCVPATWERVLRYLGIPADMYVLAMAGQTQVGGGTSVRAMEAGANEIVRRNGRRMSSVGGRITTQFVSRYIDSGLPMMWTMYVDEGINKSIFDRTKERRGTTDWSAYEESLKPFRKAARRVRTSAANAHMCMIIGYNDKTDEIAISDSWGPQFAERWITPEEANAISQGNFTVINW